MTPPSGWYSCLQSIPSLQTILLVPTFIFPSSSPSSTSVPSSSSSLSRRAWTYRAQHFASASLLAHRYTRQGRHATAVVPHLPVPQRLSSRRILSLKTLSSAAFTHLSSVRALTAPSIPLRNHRPFHSGSQPSTATHPSRTRFRSTIWPSPGPRQ